MDNEKYRSPEWQENKLKELYYAFGISEEEGLKLFLNLALELLYENPSFFEKLYHAIEEIQQEGIYDVSEETLNWVEFWKVYNNSDEKKNPLQLRKLKELKDTNYVTQENLRRLYFQLGFIEYKLNSHENAARYYEESLRSLPNWSWTYYNLGIVYADLGRHDEAIAAYQKAIELDPKYAKAYYNLGNVYDDLGRKDEAITAYQKAIELDPTLTQGYYNLGIVYADLDSHDEAIAAYQKAIELDPKDAAPHNSLGYLFLQQGQLDSAKASLEQAIALDENAYWTIINLGITYFHLKDKQNAQAQFRSTLEKCPLDSVHGRLNKVTALLGLEQNEAAQQLLQQTKENFTIQPAKIKEAFTDWNLLANSPEPPAGIREFLERAKEILET